MFYYYSGYYETVCDVHREAHNSTTQPCVPRQRQSAASSPQPKRPRRHVVSGTPSPRASLCCVYSVLCCFVDVERLAAENPRKMAEGRLERVDGIAGYVYGSFNKYS